MRLIDADQLKKNFQDELCKGIACAECSMQVEGFCRVERWIEIAPTVEAEPIKHGHWIYDERNGNYYCSECHRRGGVYIDGDDGIELLGNYCGICGAKMDETSDCESCRNRKTCKDAPIPPIYACLGYSPAESTMGQVNADGAVNKHETTESKEYLGAEKR